MKIIKSALAQFEYKSDILYVKPLEGLFLDKPEMESLLNSAIELTEGKKYFAIIDTSNDIDSTKDAREYYANNELNRFRYADAFIVSSLPLRMVVNFFIRVNKPSIPTKMFNSKDSAFEWINELKKKNLISY